jgi:glycosyltransferase involved in cell wall biosynthesis
MFPSRFHDCFKQRMYVNLFVKKRMLMSTETNKLHLLVDGKVYGFQKHGGINTYFNEVLSRLARRSDVTVELMCPQPCVGNPPNGPVNRARLNWLPSNENPQTFWGRLLKRGCDQVNGAMRNWRAKRHQQCVFHSTFFTRITDRVPQVATAYDMNHELLPEKYSDSWGLAFRARVRDYMKRATRIIAISKKTKTDLVRLYEIDPERVDVVHLAVDPKDFWSDQSPEREAHLQVSFGLVRPYLLYVGGRAHHYKNFDRLLKAFATVARTTPLTLAVAGIPPKNRRLC